MIAEHLPALVIVLPLVAAYLMLLLGSSYARFAEWTTVVVTGVLAALSVVLALQATEAPVTYHFGGWKPPWGIEFFIGSIEAFFLMVVAFIGFFVALFGFRLLAKEVKPGIVTNYFALYLILMASLLGIAASNDLFNIFVFLEISSVSAAALVAVNGNKLAMEAAVKYIILSTLGSGSVLLAIANLYMVTGYLNLTFIGEVLPATYEAYPLNVLATVGLFMVGLTVKAALYPLHVWLPDAHGSAPTTSSAVLSGLVVKVYIILLFKLIFRVFALDLIQEIPLTTTLLIMSTLAIFLGSLLAIQQTDIKKMLAYSTVGQIGYVFLGIGLLTVNGILGGLLHILNHAVIKAMLFLSAGLLIKLTGRRDLRTLAGVGRQCPIPMAAFSLGALSMVGIPPLNGFISKWHLGLGALDADQPVFLLVILISSFLNGLYYFPIVIRAFFGEGEPIPALQPIPLSAKISLVLLGIATLVFGLFPSIPIGFLTPAVEALLH